MAPYLDLEKAVDYLVDETPEGAPFRDGKVFVHGHFVEKKADPPQPPPPDGQVFEVIRTGRNDAGEATVSFRGESPSDPDLRILASGFRLSDWQPRGLEDIRQRFALPLIVRLCAEGRWKADGKAPGSAKRKDIRARDFIGSEIDHATGDLMSPPGPTSNRPESTVTIWTNLMFSVPSGADEGKVAELSEPTDPAPSDVRPNRRGRKKGVGGYDSKDKPLIKEMHRLINSGKATSPSPAAYLVVDKAVGEADTPNKVKRLVKRYLAHYSPGGNHSL